ncbi:DUF58 domain-containing protein (plasmid) [Halorussus salilacus]|uniref:DUF58 domain-containing protein n=1 Tax=Halorussus salilacus TaxID=2953750 RepID=UPI00209CE1D5|nr:DUF58 domain-containing protein [Halorussus salilacus]USZ69756.1 DUF58 domain-containing protein [Halorussus salilacus]
MEATRRYWGEAGVAVVLAGSAVLFGRAVLLVGAAGVAGWLVARQYLFVRAVSNAAEDLSVTQSVARDATSVGDDLEVVLGAELHRPAPVGIELEADLPVGVEVSGGDDEGASDEDPDSDARGPRASLSVGERSARTTFAVRCRVAGDFQFGRATVTATDATGRFRAVFPAGPEPRVSASPRGPTNVHVGVGGDSVEAPYGEYASSDNGSGLDPDDIRAYVPGHEVRQIDWNATARLGFPHVREFEATTERRTALLVDCRASMATGPDGETAFDYARQIALAVVGHARDSNEPVNVYAVGEAGLLRDGSPSTVGGNYAVLERWLRALEPGPERSRASGGESEVGSASEAGTGSGVGNASEAGTGSGVGRGAAHSPAAARRRSRRLSDDRTAFAARLEPFFADADPYVERVADDPLYRTAKTRLERLRGNVTTVVLTDDSRRAEVLQTVKVARRYDDHVVVFLTPRALFDRGSADLESTYDRYVDFELFRRELAELDGVSAFEVAPGDRLDALMAANETGPRTGEATRASARAGASE